MSSYYDRDKTELNIREIFLRLLQCLWPIVLATVLGGSVMFGVGKAVTEPAYRSTTRVVVLHRAKLNALTNSDLLISTQLKDYYSDVVTSRYVAEEVIEDFGLNISYEQFVDKITISQYVDGSRIVNISLDDRDPYMAKVLVDALRDVSIARMEELLGVETVKINIVEDSNFPVKPSNTGLLTWVLWGGLGGFLLMTFMVVLLYLQEDTIRTPEDIEKYLELSTLGMVPLRRTEENPERRKQQENKGKKDKKAGQKSNSRKDYHFIEAFKTIRNNVEFCGSDTKVVAITSCVPNEGKSSVSYELAHTFAQTGRKVLLIDADLRKSVLVGRHSKGKVLYGLTHYLIGKQMPEEVRCETDLENFHIIYAGTVPPNPCELLGNQLFEKLLAEARSSYDMVIVDTPPVGSVIDGAVVAQKCDGVVIVISTGEISYRFARKVKEQVEKSGSRILGCILNKVDLSKNSQYGYYGKYYGQYYGKYYDKYYDEEAEDDDEEYREYLMEFYSKYGGETDEQ